MSGPVKMTGIRSWSRLATAFTIAVMRLVLDEIVSVVNGRRSILSG